MNRCDMAASLSADTDASLRSDHLSWSQHRENTVVGAGAVVARDLPANVIAVGNPAQVIRSL